MVKAYSVRENVTSAKVAASAPHKGSSVAVVADTSELTERADQSTWPTVEPDETGAPHVARGPHNIVRRLVEFACEHPELELYIGTPTEVLATLVALGRSHLDVADLMFCENLERLVVWQRPAACADAGELGDIASSIGIPISERTAHRILAGELAPLEPVLAQVTSEDEPDAKPAPDIYRDRRSLRIHHGDLEAFRAELSKAFDVLAERYYLSLKGEPKVTVGRDAINVRFPVEKDD